MVITTLLQKHHPLSLQAESPVMSWERREAGKRGGRRDGGREGGRGGWREGGSSTFFLFLKETFLSRFRGEWESLLLPVFLTQGEAGGLIRDGRPVDRQTPSSSIPDAGRLVAWLLSACNMFAFVPQLLPKQIF